MKKLARTLLAGLMACPVFSFAQITPLFEAPLYFEDSIGNRDTIMMGYDTSASSQNLNPQFGEVLISAPFDSIFEVRVLHSDDSQERTSKKVIGDYEVIQGLTCGVSSVGRIVIHTKYPPIKMTYDSTLFPVGNGTCKNYVLSPEWNIHFLPHWWDVCDYYCLGSSSLYVDDFVVPPPASGCWNRLFLEKEVEGQGFKMLPGFFLEIFNEGPCTDTSLISKIKEPISGFGTLTPNPVSSHFSIQMPSEGSFNAWVVDVTGKEVVCPYEISGNRAQFDVSGLSQGIYFVSLNSGRSSPVVYKFVKL
jgi:hypothetical protein